MRRGVSVVGLVLLLTGCVIPNFYGPDFANPPREGTTVEEVRAHWGAPWHAESYRTRDHLHETYWYRHRQTVVMPGRGGGYRYNEYDWYAVHFRDGVVVGGSW